MKKTGTTPLIIGAAAVAAVALLVFSRRQTDSVDGDLLTPEEIRKEVIGAPVAMGPEGFMDPGIF